MYKQHHSKKMTKVLGGVLLVKNVLRTIQLLEAC